MHTWLLNSNSDSWIHWTLTANLDLKFDLDLCPLSTPSDISRNSSTVDMRRTCGAASPTRMASRRSRTYWPTSCCACLCGLSRQPPALATSSWSACAPTYAPRTNCTPCASSHSAVSATRPYRGKTPGMHAHTHVLMLHGEGAVTLHTWTHHRLK